MNDMNTKAQSTMETAILILIIVAALFAMQVYLKRGIQGRLRSDVESIGQQYDPEATESNSSTFRSSYVRSTTVGTPVIRTSGGARWTVLETESNSETLLETTNSYSNEVVGRF